MEYRIITAHNANMNIAISEVEERVDAHLESGWKLTGGVQITLMRLADVGLQYGNQIVVVAQAMILESVAQE